MIFHHLGKDPELCELCGEVIIDDGDVVNGTMICVNCKDILVSLEKDEPCPPGQPDK